MPSTNPYPLSVLIILIAVTLVSLMLSIFLTAVFLGRRRPRRSAIRLRNHILVTVSYALTFTAIVFSFMYSIRMTNNHEPTLSTKAPSASTSNNPSTEPSMTPETTVPTVPPTTTPTEPTNSLQNVGHTTNSNPDNWKVDWDIIQDQQIIGSYNRDESIFFGDPNKDGYFALPGIGTFRGDNYRTGAAYGSVNIINETLTDVWSREISSLKKGSSSGIWTGCGWTGQPLIVQWDEQTKQNMNLYADKKAKEDLVEVIYATLDGHIYFYDLEDGTYTRDPMNVGMAFKGAGSLDPRGYPIMYVGSGDSTAAGKTPRMFIISLIDCSIMYEYGHSEDMRYRDWIAFDSAPLVDEESDTLIWPGESGVLYTMKLNTNYDPDAGTLSVAPTGIVKNRYKTSSNRTLGFEASAIIVENYIYISDNGGMLFCVDLNTMALVWAQDTKDDNNATPVFEWGEDGNGYLYCATSMEYCNGSVYMYKINAATGEIVWETQMDNVYFDKSVSGGVLSSPVLGKTGTELEGMIIWSVSRTPNYGSGALVALDTDTGEIIWQQSLTYYCWSSPVAVYSESGKVYLVLCDSVGYVMLMDAVTGTTITSIGIGANVEASPAIFNDMLVIGTRGMQVHGIRLS